MKRTFALLAQALTMAALVMGVCNMAVAQSGAHLVWATEYNNWSLASQAGNSYVFTGTNCINYSLNGNLPPNFIFGNPGLSVNYPVWIQDANPSNSEIVTPSAISTTTGACGFTASTTYTHPSFTVRSGTVGLQDAVGALGATSSAIPWNVLIDKTYYGLVSGLPGSKTVGGIIAALKGTTNVQVVDTTTNPWTTYSWNGSVYFSNGGGVPVAALGTGAGTSPTGLVISGNGAQGVVSFTTGTSPTASAAIFTLTYPSGTTSTGFNHQPTCTIKAVGATSYTAGTVTYSGSASAGYVVTVPATSTALTAATFYSFSYTCN